MVNPPFPPLRSLLLKLYAQAGCESIEREWRHWVNKRRMGDPKELPIWSELRPFRRRPIGLLLANLRRVGPVNSLLFSPQLRTFDC